MPNYSAYKPRVRVIVEALSNALESNFELLSSGSISVSGWKSIVEEELAKHIMASFMSGRKKLKLSKAELAQISQWVQAQLSFLDRFAAELENWPEGEEYPPKFKRRAMQYATAVVNPFYSGETWGIPLPAMPGDGTSQCGQADKCSWKIDKLEGEGNWDAYWKLHPAEHCQTCIERARVWNPLQIRNYRLLIPDGVLAKEISGITKKHLRGMHDQKTHGRRVSSPPANRPGIGKLTTEEYDNFVGMEPGKQKADLARKFLSSGKITINDLEKITSEMHKKSEPKSSPTSSPNVKTQGKREDAEQFARNLTDATGNSIWAVRYTNDWKRDSEKKTSFVDWGIDPYKSRSAAKRDYPNHEIVFDKSSGGYLPSLGGLSSFSDWSAASAVSRGMRWSGGGSAYKYMVIYKAEHVGFGPDGEDLTVPTGESYVFA